MIITLIAQKVEDKCKCKCNIQIVICHFCRACRSAAVKFSPEIVHESCHGFSRDVLQLQMPNFMAFFILQTFVLDI